MMRNCGSCDHFRGNGQRCASPDLFTRLRALRWATEEAMCKWHERKDGDG